MSSNTNVNTKVNTSVNTNVNVCNFCCCYPFCDKCNFPTQEACENFVKMALY